jgi:hypothetical protein
MPLVLSRRRIDSFVSSHSSPNKKRKFLRFLFQKKKTKKNVIAYESGSRNELNSSNLDQIAKII